MKLETNFKGKTVVITGATSGIGLQAARAFAGEGAFVVGVGRSQERCRQAEEVLRANNPQAQARYLPADLSIQRQVRRLASDIRREIAGLGFEALDILVNNAGTYAGRYIRTPEGIELTLAVNHLAPFLLTHELLPLLSAAPTGRVITISSASHYHTWLDVRRLNKPVIFVGLWAYKVSKLANVLFTLELNRRISHTNLRAFAVDPGLVNTEIGLKGTDWFSRNIWQMRRRSGVHPEVPARTILYVAGAQAPQDSRDIYWYNCHPVPPSRQALRADLARQLWEASCELCAIQQNQP
ncbi:MAG: SDR family NAD(P)-dependent oxidoreductase [Omnitrophica WOR_2 bacterium]